MTRTHGIILSRIMLRINKCDKQTKYKFITTGNG